jgi:hypothetical protein
LPTNCDDTMPRTYKTHIPVGGYIFLPYSEFYPLGHQQSRRPSPMSPVIEIQHFYGQSPLLGASCPLHQVLTPANLINELPASPSVLEKFCVVFRFLCRMMEHLYFGETRSWPLHEALCV